MNYDEIKKCVHREYVDNQNDKAILKLKYSGSKETAEKLLDVIVNIMVCVSNLQEEDIDIFFTTKVPK